MANQRVNTDAVKNQMKAQSGQQPAQAPQTPQSPGQSIAHYLADNMKTLKSVLPKHMTPERMARIALSEIRKNPALLQCDVASLGAAVMQCATLGLEPGVMGHVYFVPFWNNKEKRRDVQFIIGYKGLIDLTRRSGEVLSIQAMEVRQNDTFEFEYGIDEKLRHIPAMKDRGAVTHYYAYAKFKDGGHTFLVMSREDILEHAANFSKQQNDKGFTGPWKDHFDSMAKKTVIRAMIKYMPISIEVQEKISHDERVIKKINPYEDGAEIESSNIFDMELPEEKPQPQQIEKKTADTLEADELAEMEKEMIAARAAQEELDKKKATK